MKAIRALELEGIVAKRVKNILTRMCLGVWEVEEWYIH